MPKQLIHVSRGEPGGTGNSGLLRGGFLLQVTRSAFNNWNWQEEPVARSKRRSSSPFIFALARERMQSKVVTGIVRHPARHLPYVMSTRHGSHGYKKQCFRPPSVTSGSSHQHWLIRWWKTDFLFSSTAPTTSWWLGLRLVHSSVHTYSIIMGLPKSPCVRSDT